MDHGDLRHAHERCNEIHDRDQTPCGTAAKEALLHFERSKGQRDRRPRERKSYIDRHGEEADSLSSLNEPEPSYEGLGQPYFHHKSSKSRPRRFLSTTPARPARCKPPAGSPRDCLSD